MLKVILNILCSDVEICVHASTHPRTHSHACMHARTHAHAHTHIHKHNQHTLVTHTDITMGIKPRADFFPILWVTKWHQYRNIVEGIAIIIPTCHLQYRWYSWNLVFLIIGQASAFVCSPHVAASLCVTYSLRTKSGLAGPTGWWVPQIHVLVYVYMYSYVEV